MNNLHYVFDKTLFHEFFLESNPQCKDCIEVSNMTFGRDFFHHYMRKEICTKCEKYSMLNLEDVRLKENNKIFPY